MYVCLLQVFSTSKKKEKEREEKRLRGKAAKHAKEWPTSFPLHVPFCSYSFHGQGHLSQNWLRKKCNTRKDVLIILHVRIKQMATSGILSFPQNENIFM
ncbi:hypothetical protein POVWA2_051570 [Plasmodium ovale wallikeri]|uniref:Uncharacterized protein n=1 Tax=Plasmodium ovale wallikeri TaxID=864142 RepID=A0A1A8YMF8_PLAOA|nr:hypothetical protein POVWA1_013620 [Plasmodium ovale wallikeri]SBT46225.1 hypothetical protein POVWA2_051570 [Plasmodium ovale wallikeri]